MTPNDSSVAGPGPSTSLSRAASMLGHGAPSTSSTPIGAFAAVNDSAASSWQWDEDGRDPAMFGLSRSGSVKTKNQPAEAAPSLSRHNTVGYPHFRRSAWNHQRSDHEPDSTGVSKEMSPHPLPSHITSHPLFSHHAAATSSSPADEPESRGRSRLARVVSTSSSAAASHSGGSTTTGIRMSRTTTMDTDAPIAQSPLTEAASDAGIDLTPLSMAQSQPDPALSPASAFLSAYSGDSESPHMAQSIPSLILSPPVASLGSPSDTRVACYTLGKIIGRGGFSTVRLATHDISGERFACRIIKRDDLSDQSGSLENFEIELKLWRSLPAHPRILPCIEMHRTPQATYLISPLMTQGSLLDVVKRERGGEATARKYFPHVVEAVRALHEGYPGFDEGGMLHGDLKLDNFLVGEHGEVCIADFGLAQKLKTPDGEWVHHPEMVRVESTTPGGSRSRSRSRNRKSRSRSRPRMQTSPFAGSSSAVSAIKSSVSPHNASHNHHFKSFPSASLPYAPPELLRAPPSPPSLAQDIWALGIILYALLTSRLPFADTFDPRLQMKILKGDYVMPNNVGPEWIECLRGCLDGDKRTRWDIKRLSESDALTGWRGVKPRSRSRSRVRSSNNPSPIDHDRDSSNSNKVGVAINRDRSNSGTRSRQPHHLSHYAGLDRVPENDALRRTTPLSTSPLSRLSTTMSGSGELHMMQQQQQPRKSRSRSRGRRDGAKEINL